MSTEHFGRDSADEILTAARLALREWENSRPFSNEEHAAAERLSSAFGAMDDLLSHGGELPSAWGERGVRNQITGGMQQGPVIQGGDIDLSGLRL